ncbi:ABC transporter ATP-binding protein [Lawsonella clevelandensis]|uniref:Trehalose import ATP-binding protein SugC n=1 Tax=Lawsonella clevelandensis TaxID=1528099 RepID=A0A5E3ZY50_9ACTN|nr:sn-glycerol-3-phosphate ABC transporter ATP-binding protein UgpC [Lawsonella clevelandensis]MDU7192897.1 sn-glycerol-3-phosphate ABC transporter ATP-binding protein UgpC [Lawsonella clevelandensis]VHO00847.1 Trehalose import ATP-binding protein SugC [Lawsonella clevelandensis]
MASVTFDHATCIYPGAAKPSVDNLCLDIRDGEFLVLVGPSGCGKSTTLRMLAGLEFVDSGKVWIGDDDVTLADPKDRDIAMVFQNYALYPHMTVAENMGFALKLAKVDKKEIRQRVEEAARLLDLTDYLDRKPKALSGGQRQRVAMGRAIVRSPRVFLMDEPLSNLDARLRVHTRAQIAELQQRLGTTTVYVTHDQVEAMTMGDRVAVLCAGQLQQVDTPRNLFDHPANAFVAGFIGSPSMNILTAPVRGASAWVGETPIPLPDRIPAGVPTTSVLVGFRPERVEGVVAGDGVVEAADGYTLYMRVDLVEELGSQAIGHGHLANAAGEQVSEQRITAAVDWQNLPARGDLVRVTITPEDLYFFADDESGVTLWDDIAATAPVAAATPADSVPDVTVDTTAGAAESTAPEAAPTSTEEADA